MTLLASAADSLLDFMVSLLNLFALKESAKPADKEHNY
jgi:divalent metal cation (Fe/Co/Zn/Cd) transporter